MNPYVTQIIAACGALDPLAVVISVLALLFIFMMWRATVKGHLDWKDMVTSKGSNKVSLTKVLQLVGGVTGTWMMVYLTMKGNVSSDFFFTYLAYVGAIEGWSKFIAAKYGGADAGGRPAKVAMHDNGYADQLAMGGQYPPQRQTQQHPRNSPPRFQPTPDDNEPMSARVPPDSLIG